MGWFQAYKTQQERAHRNRDGSELKDASTVARTHGHLSRNTQPLADSLPLKLCHPDCQRIPKGKSQTTPSVQSLSFLFLSSSCVSLNLGLLKQRAQLHCYLLGNQTLLFPTFEISFFLLKNVTALPNVTST